MLLVWRVLFAAALVFTAYATLSPLIAPPVIGSNDKLVHMTVFTVDALLGLAAFPAYAARRAVLVGLVLFGGAIEGLQGWVPHRRPSMGDALANTVGVSVAAMIWLIASKLASKASPRAARTPHPPAPDP